MRLSDHPDTQAGLATRRAVLGDTYVQASLDRATDFTAPLQELVTRHAWGNTWQRKGIDLKTRSIVTVAMLTALGRTHELKIHVRGAQDGFQRGCRTHAQVARRATQTARAAVWLRP